MGLMWDRMFWGQPGKARDQAQREAGRRIMEASQRHGDIWLASKGHLANALDLAAWGHPGDSRAEFMKLMALSRETNDPRPRGMGLYGLAILELFAGNYQDAIENADEALRVSLNPIDRLAAISYKSIAMILSKQEIDTAMNMVGNAFDGAVENGLIIFLSAGKMGNGVGQVLQGRMAQGIRAIEAASREYEGYGMVAARPQGDMFLGETYLQIALGGETPPLSVMLANFPFLLRTLPFAKKKARHYLQKALNGFIALDAPSFAARCHYLLGLLEKAAKQSSQARTSFQEARDIAASVAASNIVADADKALAELPA